MEVNAGNDVGLNLLLLALLGVADGHQARERPRADPPARTRPAQPNVYFANCTAARAAGRQNIRRGEPGYRPQLDRDNDGVACESR